MTCECFPIVTVSTVYSWGVTHLIRIYIVNKFLCIVVWFPSNSLWMKRFSMGLEIQFKGKSNCCFCKGSGFGSQHKHGCFQPSVILVSGNVILSFGLSSGSRCAHGAHMHVQANIHMHEIKMNTQTKKKTSPSMV